MKLGINVINGMIKNKVTYVEETTKDYYLLRAKSDKHVIAKITGDWVCFPDTNNNAVILGKDIMIAVSLLMTMCDKNNEKE